MQMHVDMYIVDWSYLLLLSYRCPALDLFFEI